MIARDKPLTGHGNRIATVLFYVIVYETSNPRTNTRYNSYQTLKWAAQQFSLTLRWRFSRRKARRPSGLTWKGTGTAITSQDMPRVPCWSAANGLQISGFESTARSFDDLAYPKNLLKTENRFIIKIFCKANDETSNKNLMFWWLTSTICTTNENSIHLLISKMNKFWNLLQKPNKTIKINS